MTAKTSQRGDPEERMKLAQQINEWNANRYDLFAISLPNEDNEYFGVMRYFFQETGSRVSTKCVRVSNTASVVDVINTLVEKFRPDMRMLSLPRYGLYEVHVNGDERKLRDDEYPLVVQLNWGKDDREGRFLLKNMDEKTALPKNDSITNTTENPVPEPSFKRKLSKREKKELKKKEKEAKLKDKENKSPGQDLYKEVPDTSFTRSISNPEAVMRRRRQLKLEKKLQQIRSQDGGPDKGGTLKIYGESIHPDVPYKTLLLSTNDTTAFVVKETLEKYGMEKEDPETYCLVQVLLPPGGPEYHGSGWGGHKEYILEDDDCPLSILMHTPPSKGTVVFQLKRRPPDMAKKRKKRSASANRLDTRDRRDEPARGTPQADQPPSLVEINPDGSEPYKARRFVLPPNNSEVGSEAGMSQNGQYMQLHGPDIYPRHCVFTFTEGVVTVTPMHRDAETYVNDQRINQTTMLQDGMVVRFGKMHTYRFSDPFFDQPPQQAPVGPERLQGHPDGHHDPRAVPHDTSNFETTFDVDGHIETKTGPPGYQPDRPGELEDLLPCTLQYEEQGEDTFLLAVINEVNGNMIQFKLSPTYILYMAVRYRIRKLLSMDMSQGESSHWIHTFGNKIVSMMQRTIQESRENAGALSFWMANSSELLHFLKQDGEICAHTKPSQDQLAQVVQTAFHYLVDCMQADLNHVMPAFLDESMDDLQNEDEIGPNPYPSKGKPTIGDVLQVLSSAMSLLRRCRVNAALTIQLFSQLFHFVNMWLFNEVVLHPEMQLCTAGWGHRLKRRLGRVEIWAEKHGLELAADCHLSRIIQAAHLLEAPKSNPDDIANISSTCFKLNSLQLRHLLECYIPSPGEPRIPPELISRVVAVAQNMSDEMLRSEGREVKLDEEPDLQLPFLLPEDGYSCDIVKGVPNGLNDFLGPLTNTGLCRLIVNNNSSGLWNVYMGQGSQQMGGPQPEALPAGLPQDPEVIKVTFNKVKGSIGLSIVAAKGERQRERGIYVKSVVPGGGAAQDGRLQAGDQLLKVDGQSLVGLSQEKAAEYMMHTGQTVTLEVAKQGAIYHGLTSLLQQPSPTTLPRASPNRVMPPPSQPPNKSRPLSEDVSRFTGPQDGPRRDDQGRETLDRQRPLHLQHGARSSPNIPGGRPQDQRGPSDGSRYGGPHGNQPQYPAPQHPVPSKPPTVQKVTPPGGPSQYRPDPRELAMRSQSTPHIDQAGAHDSWERQERQTSVSVSTLPRQMSQQQQARYPSHPDLNRPDERPRMVPDDRVDQRTKTYENFPGARPSPQPQPQPRPYGDTLREESKEMKVSQSMGNIRQEPPTQPQSDSRPRSEEFDRKMMQDWQKPRPGDMGHQQPSRPGPESSPYGPPQPASRGPPKPQERDLSRSQPNMYNQQPPQQQQQYYRGAKPQEPDSQFDVSRRSEEQSDPRNKPVPVPRQTVPAPDKEPRQAQHAMYDPRQSQRGPQYQQPTYPGSQGYPQQQQQPQQNTRQVRPQGPQYGYPQQETPTQKKPVPQRRDQSPDLPPPPADMQSPMASHYPDQDLPPPPPSTQDPEQQIRDEQERMMNRWDNMGIRTPSGQPPRQSGAPPQTYQNLPGSAGGHSGRPTQPSPESQPPTSNNDLQYHYAPRPAPPQNIDKNIVDLQKSIETDVKATLLKQQSSMVQNGSSTRGPNPPIKKKPPPVASKPKLNASTSQGPNVHPQSPSVHSQGPQRDREPRKPVDNDNRLPRDQEIFMLESRTYLSPEERERLQRLRLDVEFDRRVKESNESRDDDSDTEMTDRALGRAKVLQIMQRDVERRQQQSQEDRERQKMYESQAEAERLERQERRLAQFNQEREEQKIRQQKRQEEKAKETEEYLRKQRELRERQRKEFEEQRRQQKIEEEKLVERQKEEIRKKKQMEQEQLREMQAAREEEERNMREAIRRQEAEMSRQRAFDQIQDRKVSQRKEQERQDKYSHLVRNDPALNKAPPAQASVYGGNSVQSDKNGPPAPPERKSSYDIYNKSGSMSNLGQPEHEVPGMGGPSRSLSAATLRQQQQLQQQSQDPYSKKSVSFDTNLTTEIHEIRNYGSTSSESSYREYQSQVSQERYTQQQESNTTTTVTTSSTNERQPFQRGYYAPPNPYSPTTPTTPVFQESGSQGQTPNTSMGTPGVIGAQEVYRDPRDRITAAKAFNNNTPGSEPQRLSFRDKMNMFAKEAGETTPQDRVKISLAQRRLESGYD